MFGESHVSSGGKKTWDLMALKLLLWRYWYFQWTLLQHSGHTWCQDIRCIKGLGLTVPGVFKYLRRYGAK